MSPGAEVLQWFRVNEPAGSSQGWCFGPQNDDKRPLRGFRILRATEKGSLALRSAQYCQACPLEIRYNGGPN